MKITETDKNMLIYGMQKLYSIIFKIAQIIPSNYSMFLSKSADNKTKISFF